VNTAGLWVGSYIDLCPSRVQRLCLFVRFGSVNYQVTFCSGLPTNLIPKDRLRLKNLIFSLSNTPCYLYYLKVYCRVREIPPSFYVQAALRKLRFHVTSLPCILLAPVYSFLLLYHFINTFRRSGLHLLQASCYPFIP